MQYIIPAAGLGIRFTNFGYSTPKPFIDLYGLPMIAWAISNFTYYEGDSLTIVLRKEHEIYQDLCSATLFNLKCKINFVYLNKPTDGAARTIHIATEKLKEEEPLIVANSDQYIFNNLEMYTRSVTSTTSEGNILTMIASSNKWSYIKEENGLITHVAEKKQISNFATVGIYGWRKTKDFKDSFNEMLHAEDKVNGEYYLAPTYNYLISKGMKINHTLIGSIGTTVIGLGTPSDFESFKSTPVAKKEVLKVRKKLNIKK